MKALHSYKTLPRSYRLEGYLNRWNEATAPYVLRTDHEHKRMRSLARAIEHRMTREGFVENRDWREFSNGSRWAVRSGI